MTTAPGTDSSSLPPATSAQPPPTSERQLVAAAATPMGAIARRTTHVEIRVDHEVVPIQLEAGPAVVFVDASGRGFE